MPLRAYAPVNPPCKICGDAFEIMEPLEAPPLTACPKCGQPVKPLAAHPVSSPQVTKRVSTAAAKQAGFSVLKRTSDGTFEKQ